MKKSTALALALTLCASQAWAYENAGAGYSVNDKNPFLKVESKKIYAFSNFSSQPIEKLDKMERGSAHVVNYYTAEEMSQILGEKFSTAYFDKEYEKLSLLHRSKLNLQTVPAPLLERERYVDFEEKNNVVLQNQFGKSGLEKIVPIVRLDTLGGKKAITLSFLYKQNDALMATDATLVSANDRLYILTTYTACKNYFVDKDKQTGAKKDNLPEVIGGEGLVLDILDADDIRDIQEALGEAMAVEQIKPDAIDADVVKEFWNTLKKFVKSFKAVEPSSAVRALAYTDVTLAKSIRLPDDWFYGQIQFNEKEARGSLTVAASLPTMKKIASEIDYSGMFSLLGMTDDKNKKRIDQSALDSKAKEETRKVLTNLDALLLTCSFNVKDKDLQDMMNASVTDKLITDMLLRETLHGLKYSKAENFELTHYKYDLDFKQDKALIDISTKVKLLQEFNLNNQLRFAGCKNAGTILFYLHKPDWETNEQMAKDITQWQF